MLYHQNRMIHVNKDMLVLFVQHVTYIYILIKKYIFMKFHDKILLVKNEVVILGKSYPSKDYVPVYLQLFFCQVYVLGVGIWCLFFKISLLWRENVQDDGIKYGFFSTRASVSLGVKNVRCDSHLHVIFQQHIFGENNLFICCGQFGDILCVSDGGEFNNFVQFFSCLYFQIRIDFLCICRVIIIPPHIKYSFVGMIRWLSPCD